MQALFIRHVPPRVAAGFSRLGNRPRAPQFFAGAGVMGGDDARFRAAFGLASPPGNHFAVGDDGAGRLLGAPLVIQDLGLPRKPAGLGVQGEDVVVGTRVDDEVPVDREVPVDGGHREELAEILGQLPAVLPFQIACLRVEGFDDVERVGEVHHAVVHEGRSLLDARPECARPHHPQGANVIRRDVLERAVAPAIQRPAPHQPVGGRRVSEDGVGDGLEWPGLLCREPAGRPQRCRGQRRREHARAEH